MSMDWTGRTATWVRPPIALVTRQAAELREQGADLIDLGQAIVGVPPPLEAIEAVRAYLAEPGPHPYSPDPGLPELREAIAIMLRERKGIAPAVRDRVMVTCGANQAFANALLTVTQPGDEVLTFDPGYFDHGYTIRMAGCEEIPVPLPIRGDRYAFDLAAVEAALTPRSRVVVLVSPGNPTGAVAPRSFVENLVALCRERGLWLLSDETYDLLTYEPAVHHSPGSLDDGDNIVVIGSFSKVFGLAGWRVGYYYGSGRLMEESFKVQDALVVCAPVASQRAVVAALRGMDSFAGPLLDELQARRTALLDALDGWDAVQVCIPDGATFLMSKLMHETDDVAFCQRMLRDVGVVSVPGSAFGAGGRGTVRLSFGNQPVDRLREVGARLRSGGG